MPRRSSKKRAAKNKNTKKSVAHSEPEKETIDLTEPVAEKPVEMIEPTVSPSPSCPLPKPRVVTEGGITLKQKKRKSGAEEILTGIKKRQTSGKMIDKQMELATKLAEFEAVEEEIAAMKSDEGATYLCKVPKPPKWVTNPNERPSYLQTYDGLTPNASDEALNHLRHILPLSQCQKFMNIEVHPHLLRQWYMKELRPSASALGIKVLESTAVCYRALLVSRSMPRELVAGQEKTLAVSNTRQGCLRHLYILAGGEAAQLMKGGALAEHMAARQRILGGQITLLVVDTAKYFKKGKQKTDLTAGIVDLMVSLGIDTLVMKSPEELVSTILQFTRAVAEEPVKLAKRKVDEEAAFYMRGDNKNCVTVDKDGNGRSRAWAQMLSTFPHASLEVGRSLRAHYDTPRSLAEEVKNQTGVTRLGDTRVERSTLPGTKSRRLGKSMAGQLALVFSSLDGDAIVE